VGKKGGTKFDGYLSRKSLLAMALAWHGSKCGEKHLASLHETSQWRETPSDVKTHFQGLRPTSTGAALESTNTPCEPSACVAARSGGKAVLEPLAKLIAESPVQVKEGVPVMPYGRGTQWT
jgi:hypothetical protein